MSRTKALVNQLKNNLILKLEDQIFIWAAAKRAILNIKKYNQKINLI